LAYLPLRVIYKSNKLFLRIYGFPPKAGRSLDNQLLGGGAEVVALHTLLHLGIAQASLALLSTCATPATVVVGIVAVVSVVHGSVHTAIFGPEEETSSLKLATRVVSSARSSGTCTIAGGNKGVKPHGYCAVYPFGFMYWTVQLVVVGIGSSPLSHPQKTTRN
jgi:hypothetical protein